MILEPFSCVQVDGLVEYFCQSRQKWSDRMDILHTMVAVLGAIIFLWFAFPFVAKGIINIGNITGMLVSVMLFGYGICYVSVHDWIVNAWKTGIGRVVLVAVALLIACLALVVVALTTGMVRAASNHPPKNTTAIVLGCRVKGSKPSRVLQERLDATYEYLVANPDSYCVLSGGRGKDEDISEAECMYQYLVAKGIEGERLILEDKSASTRENLLFSQEILKKRGIAGDVTIVTSEFHAYRAHKVAEQLGLNSYSTPSHTSFLYLPTYYVRELYGILYYVLK